MTNSDSGAALIEEILGSIAAEYRWPDFQVIAKVALPGDAVTKRQLAGDCRLVNRPARIVAEGERLCFRSDLSGTARLALFAQSANAFFMTAQDMSIFSKAATTAQSPVLRWIAAEKAIRRRKHASDRQRARRSGRPHRCLTHQCNPDRSARTRRRQGKAHAPCR
jgi:hypothetical protein